MSARRTEPETPQDRPERAAFAEFLKMFSLSELARLIRRLAVHPLLSKDQVVEIFQDELDKKSLLAH